MTEDIIYLFLNSVPRGNKIGLAVHVGARAPSSWNAEGSVPPLPKGMKEKNSLSGVSRMSTLVCCELSRAKQVVSRDGSYVRIGSRSLIGAY